MAYYHKNEKLICYFIKKNIYIYMNLVIKMILINKYIKNDRLFIALMVVEILYK